MQEKTFNCEERRGSSRQRPSGEHTRFTLRTSQTQSKNCRQRVTPRPKILYLQPPSRLFIHRPPLLPSRFLPPKNLPISSDTSPYFSFITVQPGGTVDSATSATVCNSEQSHTHFLRKAQTHNTSQRHLKQRRNTEERAPFTTSFLLAF